MSQRPVQLPTEAVKLLGSPPDVPVLVAVSGGSDSVALARVMDEARRTGGIPPLHLAHLNHRIRGERAVRDVRFVQELAGRLGWPVTCGEIDVPAAARDRRISLEHAARECRYEFLEAAARGVGARWVVLGHTADDQLETILHNILRGAGIHGLAGMPHARPIAPSSDVHVLRPLIEYSRRELIDYLAGLGQDYCTDHTNLDVAYTRNRIRHELIPVLEETWPDIRPDVTAFARTLGELDALLETRAGRWIDTHADSEGGGCVVDLEAVNALREPELSTVIRRLIAGTLGDLRRIDQIHVEMIADLAAAGSTGASLDLPRALVVRRGYGSLRFERGEGKVLRTALAVPEAVGSGPQGAPAVELAVGGETRWGGWVFETTVFEGEAVWSELADLSGRTWTAECGRPPEDPCERMRAFIRRLREIDPEAVEYLDFDRITGKKLTVRRRVPGDRFTPLGAPGQTKLKDFLIRRKVPRAERDSLPLIVADDLILVVVGLGVADAARLTENTRRILRIQARKGAD